MIESLISECLLKLHFHSYCSCEENWVYYNNYIIILLIIMFHSAGEHYFSVEDYEVFGLAR